MPEPGRAKTIRFQVFDSLQLHAKLLHGDKLVKDFATEIIPASDANFDYVLTKPSGSE
jgi:hypothetical protein